MKEYFGALSILIFDKDDAFEFFATEALDQEVIRELKEKKNWSSFDLVFLDDGKGKLFVLKDNTSKFSVLGYQIHN